MVPRAESWNLSLMTYDTELPACFGHGDLLFAASPNTQERAYVWLGNLRRRGATWAEVSAQVEEFLRDRKAPVFHVLDELERIKRLLGPWLSAPANDS